ncbi:hypothetical protein ASE75_13800 [Sphingomonas sp. Leaf17]|uniref:hypothetical protein n=1 Tax=Sphingomonas sp. Leaf17 TaxID=1735683 RepID=UPI0006F2D865|nr:hypothetical protein [Sphingomonas sp. Leaf17]KQM62697.1 hypothetical protein ASE75_13800 [Sphingomonas sp. Leaf17]
MTTQTTRRGLIGGAGLAGVALFDPFSASAASTGPDAGSMAFRAALDANDAAKRRFNSLPADLETTDEEQFKREEDSMTAAVTHADAAVPTTWGEYTRLIEHMTDGGHFGIDGGNAKRLTEYAKRLLAQGSR